MTLAQAVLDAVAAGRGIATETWEAIPAAQWDVYWDDLSPLCPFRIAPRQVKQRNALRVELLPSTQERCSRRDPDGRGLTWLLSGGDPLAYDICEPTRCPRARPRPAPTPTPTKSKEDPTP